MSTDRRKPGFVAFTHNLGQTLIEVEVLDIESGEFATISELAEREGIATSYMTRLLRLTQLEPGIIEAVLDGRQGDAVTLARLMDPFPISWIEQKNTFLGT